jgi:hypothetical protein
MFQPLTAPVTNPNYQTSTTPELTLRNNYKQTSAEMNSENLPLEKRPEDIRQAEGEGKAVEVTDKIYPLCTKKLLERIHNLEGQLQQQKDDNEQLRQENARLLSHDNMQVDLYPIDRLLEAMRTMRRGLDVIQKEHYEQQRYYRKEYEEIAQSLSVACNVAEWDSGISKLRERRARE